MLLLFIKELCCWRRATKWRLGPVGPSRPQFNTAAFKYCFSDRQVQDFLCPRPAVKLENSKTVDLKPKQQQQQKKVCLKARKSGEVPSSALMAVLLNNHLANCSDVSEKLTVAI